MDDKKEIEKGGVKSWIKLVLFLYTFVLSIEIIKKAAFNLGPNIPDFLMNNLNPIKAVAAGRTP